MYILIPIIDTLKSLHYSSAIKISMQKSVVPEITVQIIIFVQESQQGIVILL